MSDMKQPLKALVAAGAGLTVLGACASHAPTATPPEYLQGTTLDRNEIGVEKRTEFLEIDIDASATQLSLRDASRIENFIRLYRERGHGMLIMSLPQSSANPQLAVQAVAEARAAAYANGVNYEEIAGTTHGQGGAEPLVMAFQVYDAVKPDCLSMASYDYADASSNNDLPSLGCSVRNNVAAMIADPADLLGQREIGSGDAVRREVILTKFREGESTGSARSDAESGAVSEAVGN